LHLARAVHAANPPPPSLPPPKLEQAPSVSVNAQHSPLEETGADKDIRATWEAYRASRRAVIHSVEISAAYSAHAQKLIHQFRRGMYGPHIDFHVSSIGDWIRSQLDSRNQSSFFGKRPDTGPFLSYVILDMPACHMQIETVAPAMKDGALLVVFVPSVTQIGDCVQIIQDTGMRLQMEQVLELGEGISNGRIWDVRLARKRRSSNDSSPIQANEQALEWKKSTKEAANANEQDPVDRKMDSLQKAAGDSSRDGDSVMVCRPKVGKMTIGGGFIGIWRKMDSSI
jgi:hypothetical protein